MVQNLEDYRRQAITIHLLRTVEYNKKYKSKGAIAKVAEWRPYRFASNDIVFGRTVIRFSRERNCVEVEVCLTDDHPNFEDYNGAKAMSALLFSEAFKTGGSMAIRFLPSVEGGRVPQAIVEYAIHLGVKLKFVEQGYITPYEVRHFYLRLIGFSPEAMVKILQLALAEKISTERICYMVCNDLYPLSEMEIVLLGSPNPERVLLGTSSPLVRQLFLADLEHLRAAMLTTYLQLKLARKHLVNAEGLPIEVEDEERDVRWKFFQNFYMVAYHVDEPVDIPWTEGQITLHPGEAIFVLPRPRNLESIMLHFSEDMQAAQKAFSQRSGNQVIAAFILYPRDFENLSPDDQTAIRNYAAQSGVRILKCPESLLVIDRTAMARLERSRGTRQ